MQKKYQIFVSSTFRDLVEERQAVLEAILELNHIPCGMEAFPASNSTPFELIKKMIEDSDYYVLIIGARYGSLNEIGISYTEMEYDYAIELGKPILCFIHNSPDEIPSKNVDTKGVLIKKLEKFKSKVSKHIVKHWKTKYELKSYVLSSLSISFQLHPMNGWVKMTGEYEKSYLFELSEMQKKYNELQEKYLSLKDNIVSLENSDIERYNEICDLKFQIGNTDEEYLKADEIFSIQFSYMELFFALSEIFLAVNNEYIIIKKLSKVIKQVVFGTTLYDTLKQRHMQYHLDKDDYYNITKLTYKRIKIQFVSFGWVDVEIYKKAGQNQVEHLRETWKITLLGKKIMSKNIDKLNIS